MNSPCVKICKLDIHKQYCIGCLRTLEEIRDWMHYSQSRKIEVLDEIIIRRIEFAKTNDR